MKAFLLTFGTRGDVEPFIALGQALEDRGAQVVLACDAMYGRTVREAGLEWRRAGSTSPDEWRALRELAMRDTDPAERTRRLFGAWLPPRLSSIADDALTAGAAAADVLVTNSVLQPLGWILSRLGPAFAVLHYCPFRADMAPALVDSPVAKLLAVPPELFPTTFALDGRWTHTGFLFRRPLAQTRVDARMARFVATPPAPIAVTLGTAGEEGNDALMTALRESDGRFVVIATRPWPELEATGRCFVVRDVSHEWLFPRVAAVLHHGGTGTTAAALRAGRPMLILPQWGDQHLWGEIVAAHGLGPPPPEPDADGIARSLEELVGNEAYARNAERAARTVDAEGARVRAAEALERIAADGDRGHVRDWAAALR